MRFDLARTIADAVMMEGYALYPFRASAPKNRYRWTFGALAPRTWSEAGGCEPWWLEAQVLVAGRPNRIAGQLRFFHIERRRTQDADAREVASLDDGSGLAVAWDEGIVETIDFDVPVEDDCERVFALEPLHVTDSHGDGRVIRERRALTGRILLRHDAITADQPLARVTIRVENTTPWTDLAATREQVIASALASTHLVLGVDGGELLSAIDPPSWAATAAATCTSTGTYPVLVGPPGTAEVVLAAPFVMYDHPQVAPESAGDLCDACEIDELLVLRTRTMTDDEKRWARATDKRVAEMIDRSDALPAEWLARLHGATRDLHAGEMIAREPLARGSDPDMVPPGVTIGAKVRLCPSPRRTDAQDLLYIGRTATVAAIKHDVDGSIFLAVTIDDDPAAELHGWYGRFHYYRTDEVELLA
jgi:hypothetical protein